MSGNRHSTYNRFSRHFNSNHFIKCNNFIKRLPALSSIFILFLLNACKGAQSTLDPAGPAALSVARLWWGMFIFFSLVFIAIIILWFYALRPRDKEANKRQVERLSCYLIIGGGILLPGITIFVLLLFGIPIGHRMLPLPSNDQQVMHIDVIGHQWFWEIRYPDAGVTLFNELHLPQAKPIDIHATSHDVIHSFWVPRLNGKIDMIPGHINILRIQAGKTGHFRGQCAEFCGESHARMLLDVEVHSPDDFEAWLQLQKNSTISNHLNTLG
nr:cytochrome c oxidase subunit II [Legionella nagasakiensis]